jgi:hypothetical protein
LQKVKYARSLVGKGGTLVILGGMWGNLGCAKSNTLSIITYQISQTQTAQRGRNIYDMNP